MEISAKKDSDRARRIRWLFVASLLGAALGLGAGLAWRSWLAVPHDPAFAAEFFFRLAGYLALDKMGFWQLFPDSAGAVWARRVDEVLGKDGVAHQIDHLCAIAWCAAAGAACVAAGLAAISGQKTE